MIASILLTRFTNSIADNIDIINDVTDSNNCMLDSMWSDIDIDFFTSMLSTNRIDDIDSTWMKSTQSMI